MNTNRILKRMPDSVRRAIDHVRTIHPSVDMVVFNAEGRWCFMSENFEPVKFGEFDPKTGLYGGIDVNILQDASDEAYEQGGHPAVFQAYTSEPCSSVSPAKTKLFASTKPLTFRARIVKPGDYYGFEYKLFNSGGGVYVEFYDIRYSEDYDYIGSAEEARKAGAACLGQFLMRYSATQILDRKRNVGMYLTGHSRDWFVDPTMMNEIKYWIREQLENKTHD